MAKTGSSILDDFLKEYQGITTIYGEAGSGKTCICLMAAIEQAKNNNKVIFLNIGDNFPLERFKQLSKENKSLLDCIFTFNIKSFKEQQKRIKEIENILKGNISLIIIDKIGFYYRRLLKRKSDLANKMLISQLRILEKISKKIPIIITNNIYSTLEQGKTNMVGGEILKKSSNKIIELKRGLKRQMIMWKPERKKIYFNIEEKGIC